LIITKKQWINGKVEREKKKDEKEIVYRLRKEFNEKYKKLSAISTEKQDRGYGEDEYLNYLIYS